MIIFSCMFSCTETIELGRIDGRMLLFWPRLPETITVSHHFGSGLPKVQYSAVNSALLERHMKVLFSATVSALTSIELKLLLI